MERARLENRFTEAVVTRDGELAKRDEGGDSDLVRCRLVHAKKKLWKASWVSLLSETQMKTTHLDPSSRDFAVPDDPGNELRRLRNGECRDTRVGGNLEGELE